MELRFLWGWGFGGRVGGDHQYINNLSRNYMNKKILLESDVIKRNSIGG